jgi:hypothetical protein
MSSVGLHKDGGTKEQISFFALHFNTLKLVIMTTEHREARPVFVGNLKRDAQLSDVKSLFEKKGLKVSNIGACLNILLIFFRKRLELFQRNSTTSFFSTKHLRIFQICFFLL